MKRLLLALAFVCLALPASAACVSPITGNDAGGTSRTFGVTLDAGTNCYGNVALVDGANAANKVTVTAANALKVDGSAVTQPVSLTSTTITGTVAATQSGTWNVGTVTTVSNIAASVPEGAVGDTAWVSGSGSLIAIAKTIANNTGAAIPAGTALIGKVGIDQTTFGTTNGVVSAANFYEAVAASQTATVLQSSTGATGDYLSHCIIYPTSTSPGVVTVFDNTNTAANSAILFAGGATSTSNLTPVTVPVGAKSVNGAWKVTTGANVSVVCYGKFS